MIEVACQLLLPADPSARILLLAGPKGPSLPPSVGRDFVTTADRGPFEAILRLPGAPAVSAAKLERLFSDLEPGGVLLWIDRTARPRVLNSFTEGRGAAIVDRRTYLASRSGLVDTSAAWISPLPPTAKVDLVLESARPWLRRFALAGLDMHHHQLTLLTRRGGPARSWLETLLAGIDERGVAQVGDARLGQVRLTANGLAVAQIGGAGGPAWALKLVPEVEALLERCRRQQRELERLRERTDLPRELIAVLPGILESARFHGRYYSLEPWLRGVPCTVDMYRPRRCEQDIDRAIDWIIDLHRRTRTPGRSSAGAAAAAAGNALDAIESAAGSSIPGLRDRLAPYVAGRMEALDPPAVYGHGDFWLGNILRDHAGSKVTAVLDWDLASADDLPLLDPLHLLATRKGLLRGFDRERSLLRFWGGNPDRRDRTRLTRYAKAVDLPRACAGVLSVQYWLHYMRHLAAQKHGRTAGFAAAYRRVGSFLAGKLGPTLDEAAASSLEEPTEVQCARS